MSWVLLLGQRYLWPRQRRLPQIILLLPALGLTIGIAALITIMTGMNGFQKILIDSLQEISSYHLRVSRPVQPFGLNDYQIKTAIGKLNGVRSLTAFVDAPMLLSSANGRQLMPLVRAVDTASFAADSLRSQAMPLVWGSKPFDAEGQIIIGTTLSRNLAVNIGDSVQLLSLQIDAAGRFIEVQQPFIVQGIYQTQSYDIESNLVFIPLSKQTLSLFPSAEVIYGLKLDKPKLWQQLKEPLQRLSPELPLRLISTYDYNRSFFTALRTEKTVLLLLISIIFLVMAMQIYQSLRRLVVQHRQEIALLRALGARAASLQAIFILQSLIIALLSIVLGDLLGLLLASNLSSILELITRFGSGYRSLSTFTEVLLWQDIWNTNILVLLFCLGAGYLASRPTTKMLPAAILNHQ